MIALHYAEVTPRYTNKLQFNIIFMQVFILGEDNVYCSSFIPKAVVA